nr:hypothetical protein BaRGS_035104 [Batillaria attramentaria]
MPVTSLPLPMTSQEPTSFDHRQYLQDIGPIEPSETFMDLGNLVAEELRAAPTAPPEPQCGGFDALKVLDDLTPVSSMCLAQLLSPISPAADRHSVSSVSSEWSTISDQSRGFCPEGYGDPASHQRLSELGMRDGQMEEQSLYQGIPLRQPFSLCVEDEVDDSDDVFGEFTETLPCEDMFRQYCA